MSHLGRAVQRWNSRARRSKGHGEAKKYNDLAGALKYGEGYSKLGNIMLREDAMDWRRAKEEKSGFVEP